MNVFRLTGDLSHLLAIIILLIKIWRTRSCAGKLPIVGSTLVLLAGLSSSTCVSVWVLLRFRN